MINRAPNHRYFEASGDIGDAIIEFHKKRRDYLNRVSLFLKPHGTMKCLMHDGKIIAVKRHPSDRPIPDGWTSYPDNESYIVPTNQKDKEEMEFLVEPSGDQLQSTISQLNLIPINFPHTCKTDTIKDRPYLILSSDKEWPTESFDPSNLNTNDLREVSEKEALSL